MLAGLSGISSARYDLKGRGPFRRGYVIAASYRSGSTHLCACLWRTGLLGAPFEYFNYEHEMKYMYWRLGASSVDDYLERLIACRMSDNGVFGLKAHYHHFKAAQCTLLPGIRSKTHRCKFILIRRADKIAQAVSLAKAYQTRAWLSLSSGVRRTPALFYSRDFISACLEEVRLQEDGWMEWFAAHDIQPHVVCYEELLGSPARVVQAICAMLAVSTDEPSRPEVPQVKLQGDEINADWIRRYKESL